MLTFIILSLAVYRLTHLIVYDKIFNVIRRHFVIRFMGEYNGKPHMCYNLQGGHIRRFIGSMMVCHWCTGFWVAVAVVYLNHYIPDLQQPVFLVFALAAVQSLLESAWSKSVGIPPEMVPMDGGPD